MITDTETPLIDQQLARLEELRDRFAAELDGARQAQQQADTGSELREARLLQRQEEVRERLARVVERLNSLEQAS